MLVKFPNIFVEIFNSGVIALGVEYNHLLIILNPKDHIFLQLSEYAIQ